MLDINHMNCSIFWDIAACSLLEVIQRFGGTCSRDLVVTIDGVWIGEWIY
jgi:hypothetical protein